MSWGVYVQGVSVQEVSDRGVCVLGGKCPGGKCPGGMCPGGMCPWGTCPRGVLSCHLDGYLNNYIHSNRPMFGLPYHQPHIGMSGIILKPNFKPYSTRIYSLIPRRAPFPRAWSQRCKANYCESWNS